LYPKANPNTEGNDEPAHNDQTEPKDRVNGRQKSIVIPTGESVKTPNQNSSGPQAEQWDPEPYADRLGVCIVAAALR
jgi:hypothetical protein